MNNKHGILLCLSKRHPNTISKTLIRISNRMSALQKSHDKSIFIFRCSLRLHLLLELIIDLYYSILFLVISAVLNVSHLVL